MRKTKKLKASETKQRFEAVLDEVSREKTRIVVEKSGSPIAAVIPAHDLRRLQSLDAEEDALLARMGAAFSDLTEEQIVEGVARAIEDVRSERRKHNAPQAER